MRIGGVGDVQHGQRYGSVIAVGLEAAIAARPANHQRLVALNGNGHNLVGSGNVHFSQVGRVGRIGIIHDQNPTNAILSAVAGVRAAGDVGNLTIDDRRAELGRE